MPTNDNYYIYQRAGKKHIPVSKEVFDAYYEGVNVFRRRMQRNGECCCPQDKRLFCDTDCAICPYRVCKNLSLDKPFNSERSEDTWMDEFEDVLTDTADIASSAIDAAAMFSRLRELMPEAEEIGKLRLTGMTDVDIAKEIGVANTTFRSRLQKAQKILAEEFPEFF